MQRTWAERTVRAVVLGVRWDVVPPEAQAAVACLTARQWDVVCWRLNGESCESIGERQGCSNRPFTLSSGPHWASWPSSRAVHAVFRERSHSRDAQGAVRVRSRSAATRMHGRTGGESKTALDKLADAFLAEAERGPVSGRGGNGTAGERGNWRRGNWRSEAIPGRSRLLAPRFKAFSTLFGRLFIVSTTLFGRARLSSCIGRQHGRKSSDRKRP